MKSCAVLTVVVLLAAGCAQQPLADRRPVAEVVPTGVDCTVLPRVTPPSDAPPPVPPRAGSVPSDFVPVEAVLCRESFDAEPVEHEGGLYTALARETFTGDLGPLLEALSHADDPTGFGACDAALEIVPDLWLVDATGAAARAAWPRDRCGKTKPETHEALAALTSAGVTAVPDQPIDRRTYETGCGETAALPKQPIGVDLPTVPTGAGDAAGGSEAAAPTADPRERGGSEPFVPLVELPTELPRACLYRIVTPASEEPMPVPGLDEPLEGVRVALDGLFLTAEDLDRSQQDAVLAAAAGPSTGAPCAETPTAFATFPPPRQPDSGLAFDAVLYAELDGCRRLFVAFQSVHEFPAAVAEVLAARAVTAAGGR